MAELGAAAWVEKGLVDTLNEDMFITKQARNWLGSKLDAAKRSQIMFMDREDILNLYVVSNIPLPNAALPSEPSNPDEIPF